MEDVQEENVASEEIKEEVVDGESNEGEEVSETTQEKTVEDTK